MSFLLQAIHKEPFGLTESGALILHPFGQDWNDLPRKPLGSCSHQGEICQRCIKGWQDEFYLRVVYPSGKISRLGKDRLPYETPEGVSL